MLFKNICRWRTYVVSEYIFCNIICRLMPIQHIYVGLKIICRKLIRSKLFDIYMSFKVIVTYKHTLKRHIHTSVIFWWAVQQSHSRRARRNPSPRMIKWTVHEKREVNEQRPNPATAHHTITTARRPDNIRSSALVRGWSTQFMANPCRWPQRPSPETRLHFRHFRGLKVKTHTQAQRSDPRDSAKVKRLRQIGAEMVQDSIATTWGGAAGCKMEA